MAGYSSIMVWSGTAAHQKGITKAASVLSNADTNSNTFCNNLSKRMFRTHNNNLSGGKLRFTNINDPIWRPNFQRVRECQPVIETDVLCNKTRD